MLLGQAIAILDNKKRISIPVKFRSHFTDDSNIILSRGFEGCLVIRTNSEFENWQQKLLQQSEGQKEARILSRQIFANSEELVIDAKGRINIPTSLLNIGNIKSKVIFIGMINKIELWSEETWNNFNNDTKDKLEAAASLLLEF